MLTISKPLSAGQAQTYHKEEFANAQENYYSEGDRIRGEWHGRLVGAPLPVQAPHRRHHRIGDRPAQRVSPVIVSRYPRRAAS